MNTNTFYGIKLISEIGDLEAHPINSTPFNTVVMDEHGYVELLNNSEMFNWEKVFFFPNNETAKHFRDKWNMNRVISGS